MSFRDKYDDNERQEEREHRQLAKEIDELEGAASLEIRLALFTLKVIAAQQATLDAILAELRPTPSTLNQIRIAFGGTMSQTVTLASGQSAVATVLYFDQTGQPMSSGFVPPAVTFTIDNPAIATSTPGTDGQTSAIAYVSAGVANLTAAVTSAEGLALTDTEAVTCSPVVLPPPVLSSIKVDFGTPTP
jgi:hypothetical protein